MASNETLLKILIIGESAVGKSCLLIRYTSNQFQENFMTTIGVDFKTKYLDIDGQNVKLQIWDTAGQERFRAITKAYYRGAHGILVVFDISRRETFEKTRLWIDSIRDAGTGSIDTILIGNKADLTRAVSREEAEALAKEYRIQYYETSAKDNTNVDQAFHELASMALKRYNSTAAQPANPNQPKPVAKDQNGKAEGGCC